MNTNELLGVDFSQKYLLYTRTGHKLNRTPQSFIELEAAERKAKRFVGNAAAVKMFDSRAAIVVNTKGETVSSYAYAGVDVLNAVADVNRFSAETGIHAEIMAPTTRRGLWLIRWWKDDDMAYLSTETPLLRARDEIMACIKRKELPMNIFDTPLFPHMSALSFKMGQTVVLSIANVVIEELGQDNEKKPVIYFEEHDKGLVLNTTNSKVVAGLYGPETDDWIGERIELYTTDITAFGATHRVFRVTDKAPAPVIAAITPEFKKLLKAVAKEVGVPVKMVEMMADSLRVDSATDEAVARDALTKALTEDEDDADDLFPADEVSAEVEVVEPVPA